MDDKGTDQFCMIASIILNMLSTLCFSSWNSLSVKLWLMALLLMVVSILNIPDCLTIARKL
jgi:hypothetical protein